MDSLVHITAEQKQHINDLASKKAASLNMNPKKNAYVLLGHGGDQPLEKIRVPEGCIVVVKAHSGDTTRAKDFDRNLENITNTKNRSIVLNPNANKSALYNLLDDKGNHSVAIYNENDEINDFEFQPLSLFDEVSKISDSGFLKIDSKSPNFVASEYKTGGNAFTFADNKWVLNQIQGINIWDLFVDNSMYEYYYTKRNIKDICDAYTYLANVKQDLPESFTKIKDEFRNKYVNTIRQRRGETKSELYKIISSIKFTRSNLEFNNIATALQNYTQNQLLVSILLATEIKLSLIFEDINNGLIQRGIIYNLSCRSTDNSDSVVGNRLSVKLNERGRELFPERMVHNLNAERRNRIHEAALYRAGQIKGVSNQLDVKKNNITMDDNKLRKLYYAIIYGRSEKEKIAILNSKENKRNLYLFIIDRIESFKRGVEFDSTHGKNDSPFISMLNDHNMVLNKYFKGYKPELEPTNEYKQYEKNSKNANGFTYKKQNGKWLRYKKGVLWNTKNAPNNKNLRQAINTSQNQTNYVQVNGKWKTRKWNNATGKYILQNNTRKNNKFSEMANKSRARSVENKARWKNIKNMYNMVGEQQEPGTERLLNPTKSEFPANILGQ